ncbi:MAG: putative zinc-binding metallopeptidase [Bdellovibrionales bacterium]|nr:putative zinc-binding metallopeptidase [Bdellovibrionales bacterium]
MTSEFDWNSLKDEELLKLRISELRLTIEGSWLHERVEHLQGELSSKGLAFHPHVYLGDEWFSPAGVVAISIPFYLAHPRLMTLERKMMLEVEGGTSEWCEKLLRHEAGHCFDHAYGFSKTRKWRRLFGSPSQEYAPENYRPKPYSRSYVRHLPNWYAQAHPDEDFAETFAVWLASDKNWRSEYSKWPVALEKLEYIDEQVRLSAGKPWVVPGKNLPFSATRMSTTLENYYAKRKREHADEYPDFYDEDLRKIFSGPPELSKRDAGASGFMRRNQKIIIDSVSKWTGERKFPVQRLVKKLQDRCETLDLRLGKDITQTSLEVASYLATLVTNYLHTGKFKRTV